MHFSIVGGGARLVTQMYFPHEPLNQKDFIHVIIPKADGERVIGQPVESRNNGPTFRFDIVVRGRFQTPLDSE